MKRGAQLLSSIERTMGCHPLESNLGDWGVKIVAQGYMAPLARLGKLTVVEDKALTEYSRTECGRWVSPAQ